MKRSSSVLMLAMPLAAVAHDGHGGHGDTHWHATDIGFVLVVALVIATFLWSRRK